MMTSGFIFALVASLTFASAVPPTVDVALAADESQRAPGEPAPPAKETAEETKRSSEAALIEAVRGVAAKTATWRRTSFPKKLGAARATPAERRAVALETLNAWLTPPRLAARGRAWSDLGLGSDGAPAELYGALADDLAGLAVTGDGLRILVDPERLSEDDFGPSEGTDPAVSLLMMTGVRPDEPVVAHLADHALDLQRAPGSQSRTTDGLLAERAWAEGRANLIACQLLFDGVGAADVVHASSFNPAAVLDAALVPESYATGSAVTRSLLYFVYGEGFAQAAALAKSDGPAAVARALAARTASTDVLHPDRAPVGAVTMEAPAVPIPAGFSIVDRDSLGEQGIVTLVSIATGKDNLGLLTGEGWRADGVFRYESTGDPRAPGFTVWISRWLSEEEAADFVYGYGRVLQARFPGGAMAEQAPGRQSVTNQDRVYRIDRSGSTVTVRIAATREDTMLESPPPRKAAPPPNTRSQ